MIQVFYAVKNKDDFIRMNSSSGGIFYSLALVILEKSGIVYGAAYDKEFNVYHKRITKKEEIIDLQGSKYVQSNIADTYKLVKKDLDAGRKVLFSGTPCQIYALKSFLKNSNLSNLFLVDIICHGTPQVKFYNEYKKYLENKYKSKIKYINMRYKSKKEYKKNLVHKHISIGNVEPHVMKIVFENNKKYVYKSEFDIFYQLFDYFTKKSCFKCPYANLNRLSDITIGDFHEFSGKLGSFNDGNGVSILIINTIKGENLFSNIKNNFIVEEKEKEKCLQPALEYPMIKPKNYDSFITDYEKYGFNYVVKKYTNNSIKFKIKKFLYKIGLLDFLKIVKSGLK